MPSSRKKRRRKSKSRRTQPAPPAETRAAEAVTIAWMVTVTTLILTNIIVLVGHFYVARNPNAERMAMLVEVMQFAGALIGILSLAILPVVYRVRKVVPPKGLVVFNVCLAIAPILLLVVKSMQ